MENDNYFSRESTLCLAPVPRTVVIVGCGGCGSWVGILSAVMGTSNIVLIDHDKIEVHNLNRQALPDPTMIRTRYKAGALADTLKRLRPHCLVRSYEQKLVPEDADIFRIYDIDNTVVFCCTDNDASRRNTEAMFKRARVIQLSAEGERDFWAIENYSRRIISTALDTGDRDAYAAVPQWLVPNLLAAVQGIVMSRYPQARVALMVNETPETMGYRFKYFFENFMENVWPPGEDGLFPGLTAYERQEARARGLSEDAYWGRYRLRNTNAARTRRRNRENRRYRSRNRRDMMERGHITNLLGSLDGEPVEITNMYSWGR